MDQKPSVGRIVHVRKDGECIAAIVTKVINGNIILATLFEPLNKPEPAKQIWEGGDNDLWHWPERS